MSTTRQITLTENPDGKWTAYDTATEEVSTGDSPDEAVASGSGEPKKEPNPVNPDDPIFNPTTFSAGKPTDTSERIDEVLYGAEEGDTHE